MATPTTRPLPDLLEEPLPAPAAAISPENAGEIVQLARWGKGAPKQVIWSPDGQTLVVSSALGIYYYDAATLQETRRIETDYGVRYLAFLSDGKTLLAEGLDGAVRLWNFADGTLQRTLQVPGGKLHKVVLSPDGTTLALANTRDDSVLTLTNTRDDFVISLWRISDDTPRTFLIGHHGSIITFAFSPDGKLLALTGSDDGSVQLRYIADDKLLYTLKNDDGLYWSNILVFSPDGSILATSMMEEYVALWNVADGSLLRTLKGEIDNHYSSLDALAFSPDGQILASGSHQEKNIRLWQVSDGSLLKELKGHVGETRSLAFSPDGQTLASVAEDGALRLWRTSDGELLKVLDQHLAPIHSLARSPDGKVLATGSIDTDIYLWDIAGQAVTTNPGSGTDRSPLLRILQGHSGVVNNLVFLPDSQTLASSSYEDDHIRLWRISDGHLQRTLKGDTGVNQSLAPWPDGQTLASVDPYDSVNLWELTNGKRHVLGGKGPDYDYLSAAVSPNGQILAASNYTGTIDLWRVDDPLTGKATLLQTLDKPEGQTYEVSNMAFSSDGTILATVVYQKSMDTVVLWHITGSGTTTQASQWHALTAPNINSLALSPDGQIVAAGLSDGSVLLWQASDGKFLTRLTGHQSRVSALAFTPDGSLLISASWDGTIRFWGVADTP